MEFIHLVFTYMPDASYCRQLRSLLLCLSCTNDIHSLIHTSWHDCTPVALTAFQGNWLVDNYTCLCQVWRRGQRVECGDFVMWVWQGTG